MNFFKKAGNVFGILLFVELSFAQSDSLILQWAELMEEDEEIIESIQNLMEQPVDINKANREELLSIPFLSAEFADSIIARRNQRGQYSNKRQIRSIVGAEYYDVIRDFITIQASQRYTASVIHRNQLSIEKIEEVRTNQYLGDALNTYDKVYYKNQDNLRAGIVTQKDVGESSYWDFFSGYIEYTGQNWKAVLGSYYLHFGQGLVFSNPFGNRKSSVSTMAFRNMNYGGFPSLSSSENTGHLGFYVKSTLPANLEGHIFWTASNLDGRYDSDGETVTGFNYDGYHRTANEIKTKDIIRENVFGFSVLRNFFNAINIGCLWASYQYSPKIVPYQKDGDDSALRRNFFLFSGNSIQQSSLFYKLGYRNILLEGEAAFSGAGNDALAVSQSLYLQNKNASAGIKFWRLGKSYLSPSGRSFDDSDAFPQGTEGYYFALSLKPVNQLTVHAYSLNSKDLWRTYFIKVPVQKSEWLIQAEYSAYAGVFSGRVRSVKREEIFSDTEIYGKTVDIEQLSGRLEVSWRLNRLIRLRSRWETTRINQLKEHGTNIFQDIQVQPLKWLSMATRFSFYKTNSYTTRIYEYENDIPGNFSNYPLYGDGSKWYLLLKIKPLSALSLWIKYRYLKQNNNQPDQFSFISPEIGLMRSINMQIQYQF
ncbi:MAG: helix-hairpin-helix domain-containing protein [Calditrichaceae bacterium]|nr:helix-hairpin-helix domain-containing protein [Calditrichaceae bacterium]MBN2710461.1 helix-hairpin-helix domain-containing protein [Calditrichaceae bacterium]RQV93604.1 MAG: helix-hairpin-helix domain-containing protein [Calditrichota bacterium]